MKERNIQLAELIFKILFLIHLCFAFTNMIAGQPIMKVTLVVVLLLGGCLGLYRIVNYKKYLSVRNWWIFLLFLVSYIITSLVNIRFGIFESAQYLIWLVFQFGLLYALDINRDFESIQKEFDLIAMVFIIYSSIVNLIGLFMLYKNFAIYHKSADGVVHLVGFIWGRLWGLHEDPNHGAVSAVVAVLFALYFIAKSKKLGWKIGLGITILLQAFYIAFSDSRTGVVVLAVGILIYAFLNSYNSERYNKKIAVAIVSGLTCMIIAFGVVNLMKDGYNSFIAGTVNNNVNNHVENPAENETKPQIGREEDLEQDVSNRRFDIWGSGFEIFKKNPIVGIGYRNILPYALSEMPDTYIVNNDYANFDSFHNMFVDILAGQGIVGLIIFVVMFVLTMKDLWKSLPYIPKQYYEWMITLFTVFCVLGVTGVFISVIFFVNCPNTYLFWLCFGYMMYVVSKCIPKKEKLTN